MINISFLNIVILPTQEKSKSGRWLLMDKDKNTSIELVSSKAGYSLYEHKGEMCIVDKANQKKTFYCDDIFISNAANKSHDLITPTPKLKRTGNGTGNALVPAGDGEPSIVKRRCVEKTSAENAAITPKRIAKHPQLLQGMSTGGIGR